MSERTEQGRKPRRMALRLVQASPLIVLALFLLIWFSLPLYLSSVLVSAVGFGNMDGQPVTVKTRASIVDQVASMDAAKEADLWGDGKTSFDARISESFAALYDRTAEWVTTSTIEPLPFATDDPAFDPIAAWEAKTGARVWAWTVPDVARPAVVVSATADPASIAVIEKQLVSNRENAPADVYQSPDVLDYLYTNGSRYGATGALDPQNYFVGCATGGGSSDYLQSSFTVASGDELWRILVLESGNAEEAMDSPYVPELSSIDPRDEDYAQRISRIAKRDDLNIWVLGPLEGESVPLRAPVGATLADAEALGKLVWPSLQARTAAAGTTIPTELTNEQKRISGGVAGSISVVSVFNSSVGGTLSYQADEIAPQSIAYLAVFDKMPGGVPTTSERTWLAWQRFVAGWFPWLIGGCLTLFVISLVASPLAFAYERRLIAQERVAEERSRMQADAHDKVYNRLSALSKRVSSAGDEAAGAAATSLTNVADDIRATVGELQEILGSQVEHTDSALTTQPLSVQVASVCAAQAARLGISLACEVESEVPVVSARLGWDLQCILEELITNAVRHGGATHVHAALTFDAQAGTAGTLVLTVFDDGTGSGVLAAAQAPEDSTGLRGIERRAAAHAGTLEITAGEAGTTVVVKMVAG